ncbi:MAG: amidohydrolase [bacterium]|nr:amidohydrolase [Deltaproteobacteria bacterium]MCP4904013.1 amidohydrolase [bacterium]
MQKAIDCWVNVDMGDIEPPEYLIRVKEDYLKGGEGFFRSFAPEELISEMDRLGVERAIIVCNANAPTARALRCVDNHPERFSLGLGVDPRDMMKGLWELEALVRNHPTACAKVVPFAFDIAPSDALYYPLYTKCIELDLPLTINTGLPGPPMAGECQDPIHLDRVCLRFPELKLCMAHGADPWWGVATRLMIKYANLHMMTSAYSPKHFPPELIHFMNTRGKNKVLFASDHPALDFERCLGEARALDLRDGVLEKYLFGNANRFFFGERKPRYGELAPI